MGQQIYKPLQKTNIRQVIGNAMRMACTTGNTVIVQVNEVRFRINANTTIQDAMNMYLDAKRKVVETKKKLKQKSK